MGVIGAGVIVGAGAISYVLLVKGRAHPDGQTIFRERCSTCHATTAQAKQGPGLGGVVGRAAGSAPGFGYTTALRQSRLVWDEATLDRFLTSPPALVPGTTMPMTIPDAVERRVVVAYLGTLRAGEAAAPVLGVTGTYGPFADYHGDAPGTRHRITVADLPGPYATPSAGNGPSIVSPPDGARPAVPPGFTIAVFARDLTNPRLVRAAPSGDLFVAETSSGRVRVLRAPDGAAAPERVETFAEGLEQPFGIAFFPPGTDPSWVYVANVNSVVRFPYRNGDLRARGRPETVVARLTENEGGHSTRDVAFSADGKTMFVSVGSASNVAEGGPTKFETEAVAWDSAHGVGAAWGDETNRADVLAFDPTGGGQRTFATGIRNCVGLAVDPLTSELWCTNNERDGLGDNLVPDFVTHVRAGAFYGWPWFYLGDHQDPRHAGERRDLAAKVVVPDVLLQPHSAPLEIAFYEGDMFPSAYKGDAFVACHGSWNRASRTGPKVVRLHLENGVAAGDYEDFVTGFVADASSVWARPVGVAVGHDGSLFVSEDANGTVWRVSRP